jgi:hypothetical protein
MEAFTLPQLEQVIAATRGSQPYVLDVDLAAKGRVERRASHVADMVMSYLCDVAPRHSASSTLPATG